MRIFTRQKRQKRVSFIQLSHCRDHFSHEIRVDERGDVVSEEVRFGSTQQFDSLRFFECLACTIVHLGLVFGIFN